MVKELAEEILYKHIPEHELSSDQVFDITKAMIDFGKQVCELQKKECLENAVGAARWCGDIVVEEDSILNSKNVCE